MSTAPDPPLPNLNPAHRCPGTTLDRRITEAPVSYTAPSTVATTAPTALDVLRAAWHDPWLTVTRAAILQVIALFASGCGGACWASISTIASAAHVSDRTAQRAIRELVTRGWVLELREVGRSTVYRVSAERVRAPAAPHEPRRDEPEQLDLFAGGVSQCRGGGDTVTPDQTVDQTITDPPLPPRKRGGQPSSRAASTPEHLDRPERRHAPASVEVLEPPPAPPLPLDRGDRARIEWVAGFAGRDLDDTLADEGADRAVEVAERLQLGLARHVDAVVALTKPQRVHGGRLVRAEVDAPEGLRRREIAIGLRIGASRWLEARR